MIKEAKECFDEIFEMIDGSLKLGYSKLKPTKNYINDTVRKITEKAKELARMHKEKLTIEQKLENMPPIVYDEKAIRDEVLFNLVKNTWEAWEKNEIREKKLIFKTYVEKSKKNYEVIALKDNAGGIPKEIQQNLFTAFTSGKGFGRGVGLAVVYNLVKLHDGFLEFNSEEGKGTEFFIKLPF